MDCGAALSRLRARRFKLCLACAYRRRRVESEDVGQELPAAPVVAVCGSDDKIEALEERAAQGVNLFHPADRCAPRPDLPDRPPATPLPEVTRHHRQIEIRVRRLGGDYPGEY
jgi:hypothetical protein